MAKGQRKRSNKKETTKSKTISSQKKESCKNCDGKTCTCKSMQVKSVLKDFSINPLKPEQVQVLKESVDLSNRFAKLVNQQQQKMNHLAMSKKYIEKLRSGKVKPPVMKKISGNLFEPMHDLEELASMIEEENDEVDKSVSIVEGQLAHWYDEYVDALVRDYLMLKKLLEPLLAEGEIVKDVKGHYHMGKEQNESEEKSFIKEFDAQNMTNEDKKEIKELVKKNAVSSRKSGKETR